LKVLKEFKDEKLKLSIKYIPEIYSIAFYAKDKDLKITKKY